MTNRTTSPVRPLPSDRPSPAPAGPPAGDARGQARLRRPVTIWLPDGPPEVRRAPEVSREWPANDPGQSSSATEPHPAGRAPLAAAFVILTGFLSCLLCGLAPLVAAAAAVLAGAVAALAAGRRAHRDPAEVLTRAQNALLFGEDAHRVLTRLRGVEAAGRAGRGLGIARRCLEQAGRHGRLEEVMRWEAIRWMGRTLETISKDGR